MTQGSRKTEMEAFVAIRSLPDGGRIVCGTEKGAEEVRRICAELGKNITVEVLKPSAPRKVEPPKMVIVDEAVELPDSDVWGE